MRNKFWRKIGHADEILVQWREAANSDLFTHIYCSLFVYHMKRQNESNKKQVKVKS